jgi:hypothetical protein
LLSHPSPDITQSQIVEGALWAWDNFSGRDIDEFDIRELLSPLCTAFGAVELGAGRQPVFDDLGTQVIWSNESSAQRMTAFIVFFDDAQSVSSVYLRGDTWRIDAIRPYL